LLGSAFGSQNWRDDIVPLHHCVAAMDGWREKGRDICPPCRTALYTFLSRCLSSCCFMDGLQVTFTAVGIMQPSHFCSSSLRSIWLSLFLCIYRAISPTVRNEAAILCTSLLLGWQHAGCLPTFFLYIPPCLQCACGWARHSIISAPLLRRLSLFAGSVNTTWRTAPRRTPNLPAGRFRATC